MIPPRWRKVWRDIAETPGRTALAVLAMTAGTFGLGAILTPYAILGRELASTYADTHPASAILLTDDVSDAAIASVRRVPGVLDAEARPTIRGRIRVGEDQWAPLFLFVVRDFDDLRIDTFRPEAGAWPPGDDEVLLERTALSLAAADIGGSVVVSTADAGQHPLRIAGTVHAAGLAPAWMDHVVSGFVGWRSVMRADAGAETKSLSMIVAEEALDEAHIRAVADRVKTEIEARGHTVSRIQVPAPGRHPHADQMDTFLFLLGAFGALAVILGAVLVANMISALLTEQVKQVGVMKAIGASTGQVAALYLGQVAILAAISLAIGIPLGQAAGRAYAAFSAGILNANLASVAVPAWVIVLQIAIGVGVPLLVSIRPVQRASSISIHRAFSDDIGRHLYGTRRFDRWLSRRTWLPRPLMLSLRATFHRRGRLLLTVGTLAVGGAVFVSALNVSAAWTRTIAETFDARRYDIDVRLSKPYPIAAISAALATLPEVAGVAEVEHWSHADAHLVRPTGVETRVDLIGIGAGTKFLSMPMLRGRWLDAADGRAVVVSAGMLARAPELHVGCEIALRIEDRIERWTVVGVFKDMDPGATAFAPSSAVLAASGQSGQLTRNVLAVTRAHDVEAQVSASRGIERALRQANIGVAGATPLVFRRQAIEDHLVIIVSALMLATGLVVLVGGLGLSTTLSLNVLERTREIGVQSAIGASPRTIAGHIVFEGVLIGVLSWCAAIVLAVPVTAVLDQVAGRIFIKTPLDFFMSPRAAAIWFLLVVVIAALSSFHPARRAARLTVREALAYA